MVGEGALRATLDGVRPAGLCGAESGAFWLGDRDTVSRVTTVVLPSGEGVLAGPNYWRVSPEVFGSVTRWAVPRKLCLLGMAHTHMPGVPARLSRTDRIHSIQVPGFLEIVIGNAGADTDHRRWGWYVRAERTHEQLLEPELSVRVRLEFGVRVQVWRADACGVYSVGVYE